MGKRLNVSPVEEAPAAPAGNLTSLIDKLQASQDAALARLEQLKASLGAKTKRARVLRGNSHGDPSPISMHDLHVDETLHLLEWRVTFSHQVCHLFVADYGANVIVGGEDLARDLLKCGAQMLPLTDGHF